MVGRRAYDLMYRVGAPWESGPRAELVDLVTTGRIRPGRAVDLGCGSGANAVFLATQGFDVTGVDFSPVALSAARRAARDGAVEIRFVNADLTAAPEWADGDGYDLVVDYGALDDLRGAARRAMAALVHRITHPGSVVVLWCIYDEIAWWRRAGARFPGLLPGEVHRLFGAAFTVDRLPEPAAGSGFACFLLTRRTTPAGRS
jgi:SAM-dependent methyltransferase